LGYSKNSESFNEAKERADDATNELESLANAQNEVLLIGHGIMNKLIAKVLRTRGWSKVRSSGQSYWNYEIYEK
jgi:broad specificity phosphatase PhoE